MLTSSRIMSCLGILSVMLLASLAVVADSHTGATPRVDEEALARRITEQVIRELEQGEFLQKQIELGIENYIRKQREAQARAEADRQAAAASRARDIRPVSVDRDHIFGDPTAPVSLIEYSDYECPYCKRFHPTAKEAVESYAGEVNWVYRHFPLEFHNPLAQKQAESAECAGELGGNDAFWRYSDLLYERTRSNGKGFPMEGLGPLAVEIGLDASKFKACLDSGKYAARVQEDLVEGQAIGISGTPGNVLLDNRTGEVRVVSGAVPLAKLKSEIESLLRP